MMTQPSPSIEFLQDSSIYLEREVAVGKRLVILAESDEGSSFEPTLIYSQDMAVDFFGGGPLVSAYEDATTFQKGLEIYLMRVEPFQHEVAFAVLEAMTFDLLFIKDVYFKEHPDLFDMMHDFALVKQEKGNLIHIITTLKEYDFSKLEAYFQPIADLTIENGDEPFEKGKFLSLVVNQMTFKDAGAVYAGMLATTEPEVSPINKTIPDVSLEVDYTKEQILKLREVGIVAFKNTFKNGVTCTSSSCAVRTEGSVHKHISNFRIAQSLINQTSFELQPFIGSTNLRFQSMIIEEVVKAICEDFMYMDRIRDYDFSIYINELQGYIDLEIEIVPIFSVHGMTTHSRVRVFK
jgi:hypothetical protein